MEDSHGIFWVGTAGDGLHILDRSTGLFKRLRYDPAKPGNLSRSPLIKKSRPGRSYNIYTEDVTGIIWIGTLQGGLSRYDPEKGTCIHYNNGKTIPPFKDKMFWHGYTSKDGLLWMSTWEGNLYQIDPYRKTLPFYSLESAVNTVVYEESPETLWIGTDKGLIRKRFIKRSQKIYSRRKNPFSISNDTIHYILKDANKNYGSVPTGVLTGLIRVKTSLQFINTIPKTRTACSGDTIACDI